MHEHNLLAPIWNGADPEHVYSSFVFRMLVLPDGTIGWTQGSVPFGISVPGGTAEPVVTRLNAAFNEAMNDPSTRRKLLELGFVPVGGKPQDYAAMLTREIAKWRKVIKDSNIPPPS